MVHMPLIAQVCAPKATIAQQDQASQFLAQQVSTKMSINSQAAKIATSTSIVERLACRLYLALVLSAINALEALFTQNLMTI